MGISSDCALHNRRYSTLFYSNQLLAPATFQTVNVVLNYAQTWLFESDSGIWSRKITAKANLNNVVALIGKKYYQLSYDEKLIIADIFKTGRKLGMKLVVNLPKNSDEALIQSLKNGIWGIHEMEHTDNGKNWRMYCF